MKALRRVFDEVFRAGSRQTTQLRLLGWKSGSRQTPYRASSTAGMEQTMLPAKQRLIRSNTNASYILLHLSLLAKFLAL
jgi:hypothetical protein